MPCPRLFLFDEAKTKRMNTTTDNAKDIQRKEK
jgi:hypothetical protein